MRMCNSIMRTVSSVTLATGSQMHDARPCGTTTTRIRENAAVKQLVEEALGVQTLSGSKRRQQADAPDQFICPITHELMSDPVLASECARCA